MTRHDHGTPNAAGRRPRDMARRILNGYVRVIQKARSNSLESTREDRDLAALLDPALFSDDTDKLLVALARASDGTPSAEDVMNFSWMMGKLAADSTGVDVCTVSMLDERYNFVERPIDAYRAVAEGAPIPEMAAGP